MISESSSSPMTALRPGLSRLRRPDLLTPPRQSWLLSIDSVLAFFLFEGSRRPGFITAAGSREWGAPSCLPKV